MGENLPVASPQMGKPHRGLPSPWPHRGLPAMDKSHDSKIITLKNRIWGGFFSNLEWGPKGYHKADGFESRGAKRY